MPFKQRFSDEQRQAIVRAHVDFGLTLRAAVALAEKGELPGAPATVKPFRVSYATAGEWARTERNRREAQERAGAKPERIMEDALGNLALRLDTQVRKAERRARGGNPVLQSASEIQALARAAQEVAKLAGMVHGGKRTAAPKTPEAQAADDWIGELARGNGDG